MSILSRILDPFGKKRRQIAGVISYFKSQTDRMLPYTLPLETSLKLSKDGQTTEGGFSYAEVFVVNEELDVMRVGTHIVRPEDWINVRRFGWLNEICPAFPNISKENGKKVGKRI